MASNSLPSILTSMTFNSTELQRADLSVHLELVMGLNDGLAVRGRDTVVPGLEGQVERNRKRDVRNLQLVGWVQGVGPDEDDRLADWQTTRDELEALFDPTGGSQTLSGVASDGGTRSIDARPEPIAWIESPVLGVSQLSVTLVATDPQWTAEGS